MVGHDHGGAVAQLLAAAPAPPYFFDPAVFIAAALDRHARHRVVLEFTAEHPMRWLAYWRALHGLDRPHRPTADDAFCLLRRVGMDVHSQRWTRRYDMIGETGDQQLERISRRLCLPADRHDSLRTLLDDNPPPRRA